MNAPLLSRRFLRGPATGVALALAATVPASASAQVAARATTASVARAPLAAPYDSLAFGAMRWREIGPFRGGRSVAVAGSARRPNEYYMGTVGSGVFKTTDGGMSWGPVTDRYFGGTIGAVAVSASNPDVVYVGAGEFAMRGNVSHGDGVFKSTDAGRTWTYVGLADTRQISRVRIHPTNPDIVYVAAQGHVWAPNAERGVYRTRDGGKSWVKVLFKNDSTGAADLVMDPSNPNVLYAAFWQAGRLPWKLVSGGPHSGIWKSTDGGDTWTDITRNPGLPQTGPLGNMGLAVSPAKTSRIWAQIEHDSGGLFRSDDGGATWKLVNNERKLRQRAWYYSKIYADPKDTNVVYASNVQFQKSSDGGRTFRNIRTGHSDSHDLWIAPDNPMRMAEANDGGVGVSTDGGGMWTDLDFATAQFYHVTTTNHFPYRVCGAQQDNSTLCGPSRNQGGLDIGGWYDAGGGESGYIAVRPDDPDIMFAGSYGGLLTRKDARTGLERNVNPWPDNPMGHDAADAKYRFQWTFPIVLSPHDPNTMYVGSSVIFKSTNEGQSFTPISPDLTRNDPRTLGASGGPITKDQTSVEYYATVFAIAESPVTRGVIWAGSDDGLVHVSRDAGKTWTKVTPPGIGEWARVSIIEASHHRAGTAYVASNRFQLDDNAPYLFKTTDYGRTWTKIVNGIDPTEFTRVIREDPATPGLLYAGTERGVWVSFDDGANWQRLQRNLPPVPVHDLAVKEDDLIAATHGRSFWILDDLSALRQLTPAVTAKSAHLFRPRDAHRVAFSGGTPTGPRPTGQNPASGAVVYYWLKDANQTVTLDFLDATGRTIRSFTSRQDPAAAADSVRRDSARVARRDSLTRAGISADSVRRLERTNEGSATMPGGGGDDAPRRGGGPVPRVANRAGLNSFAWNMRYADASSFDGMILWAGGTQGPMAPPGTYAVRMRVNDAPAVTERFRLLADPRTKATQAELAEQFALLVKIRDRVTEANDAVKTIRSVKTQLADRLKKAPASDTARIAALGRTLTARLSAAEGEIYQVQNQSGQDPLNYPIKLNNKISSLAGVVSSADARPTAQSVQVFEQLSTQLDVQLRAMREALRTLLPPVNAELTRVGLPVIVPTTDEGPVTNRIAAEEEMP